MDAQPFLLAVNLPLVGIALEDSAAKWASFRPELHEYPGRANAPHLCPGRAESISLSLAFHDTQSYTRGGAYPVRNQPPGCDMTPFDRSRWLRIVQTGPFLRNKRI
jgi:hypothetical protein